MKEFPDRKNELKSYQQYIEPNCFCLFISYCPYYHKAAPQDFYFCLSFFTIAHSNKQLASLADICITHQFKLFWKFPLILYCEHLQPFAKEMYFLLNVSAKVQMGISIFKNNGSLTVFINTNNTLYYLKVITLCNNTE